MIQHHDFDLSQVTTFHIPATARLYAEYESIDELRELLFSPMYIEMEHLHIGGGSNLLFTSPFDGVVMHSAIKHIETVRTDGDNVYLKVSAGVCWDDFVKYCVDNYLYGAENLSYIPGEAGASAVQNVGAYGVEAKDIISEVHTIDSLTGKEKIFSREDCDYGYRHSIFKNPGFSGRYIITHVVYRLSTEKHFTLEYGPLKELAAEILDTAKKAAKGQFQLFNDEKSGFSHRNPAKSAHGIRFKATRQWVRVDSVQHVACFFIRLYWSENPVGSGTL